jgi:hypothetical protein
MIPACRRNKGSILGGMLLDPYAPKDYLFLRELGSPRRSRRPTLMPMSGASSHCRVIGVPKGWPYNKGGSGSEKRAELQRHVVNELTCCLCVSVLAISNRCQKDSFLGPWEANDQVALLQYINSWTSTATHAKRIRLRENSTGMPGYVIGPFGMLSTITLR